MRISFLLCCFPLLLQCGQSDDTPRPRAYPKVEYPERTYRVFENAECPFQFRYPVYATIEKKRALFDEDISRSCWFDLYFKQFDARIHISYLPVSSKEIFDAYVSDSYRIAYKINQRSNYMDDMQVGNKAGVGGIVMEFSGPAASPMHFFLTDTSRHFLRGALYFNAQPNPDSIGPVADFLKEDIAEMINSFAWK